MSLENYSISKTLLGNTVLSLYIVLYVLETQVKTDAARPPRRPQILEVNFLAARGSGSVYLRVVIMSQAFSAGAAGNDPQALLLDNLSS